MSNELFKNKYRIKSARATWCKYNEGKYFITICTKDKTPFFGKISEQNMILSDIGKIAAECMTDLLKHFHNITIPYYVVMPNHVHLIIIISEPEVIESIGPSITTTKQNCNKLSVIIGNYKASVTRRARDLSNGFGWQSRFHDHIIRDEKEMAYIANYIQNNIYSWAQDRYFGE